MTRKLFTSVATVLIIAALGIGGLLLAIGGLAQPEHPITATPEIRPTSPATATTLITTSEVVSPTAAATETPLDPIVATVNQIAITDEMWQTATTLDRVMSQLAGQPLPSPEETLDRLINELIILEHSANGTPPTEQAINAKLTELTTAWNVGDASIAAALAEADLRETDLRDRVRRLLQVSDSLNQIATQQDDLTAWLTQARAADEIGLYTPLTAQVEADSAADDIEVSRELTFDSEADDLPTAPPTPVVEIATATPTPQPTPDIPVGPYVDQLAPDFTLTGLDGQPLTLRELQGKPTLINFWATWCPPCRQELPDLQAIYDKHGDDINFVAVDVKESQSTVASFAERLNLTFPIVLDTNGAVSNQQYQVRGLPTTLFLNPQGIVATRHVGPLNQARIERYLTPLLESVTPETTAVEPDPTDYDPSLPFAPDFSLTAADGQQISLADYRDKQTTVLVFYRGHT